MSDGSCMTRSLTPLMTRLRPLCRNVTTVVGPVADINNLVLPLWLVILGIVLVRWRAEALGDRKST